MKELVFWIAIVIALVVVLQDGEGEELYAEYQGTEYEPLVGYDQNVENYTYFGDKWTKNCLTYRTNDTELEALYNKTFAWWEEKANIKNCGQVSSGEDIFIWSSGTLVSPIAGQAGCGGFPKHCTIDIRTRIEPVMGHEIGHVLGLGHSEKSNQLMSAWCCNPLGDDDIAGIRSLFGSVILPTLTPVPTPPRYRILVPGLKRE